MEPRLGPVMGGGWCRDPAALRSPRMPPWGPSLRTLLPWLLLPWVGTAQPTSGQFQVAGPESPVVALAQAEAVLPCHLDPPMDAQNMEVRWYRNQVRGLVHGYRDARDDLDQQMSEFRGRTEFLREDITTGRVALRIFPVLRLDEDVYKCSFSSSAHSAEAQIKLTITGSGAAPVIHVEPGHSGSIKLTCLSTGWYPEPEVRWTDPTGQLLTYTMETLSIGADGLFQVETSVTVTEDSKGGVSCFISNPVLRVEKEAHVSMADDLFPRVSPWTVALAVLLVLLIASLLVTGAVLRVTRKANGELLELLVRRKLLGKDGLRRAQEFAEDIVLDENTAHPELAVSADGKIVKHLQTQQDVPDLPERFTAEYTVLGWNSFSSGSHYWEVEVPEKSRWKIGLCSDSVNRKELYPFTYPGNGFWTFAFNDGIYQALSKPRLIINVQTHIKRLGIFLQYEDGLISFYDVTEFIHLYTYKSKFTGTLRPYFYLGTSTPGNEVEFRMVPKFSEDSATHACQIPSGDS